MAHYYEVRYWSNGIRTVEIVETAKQADERKANIQRRCGWPIPISINDMTSSWNPIKFFRELRKQKAPEGAES